MTIRALEASAVYRKGEAAEVRFTCWACRQPQTAPVGDGLTVTCRCGAENEVFSEGKGEHQ